MVTQVNPGAATLIIKAALDLIHVPGEVFEVRIPKTNAGTYSGYFNDTALAAKAISVENGRHQAIYATVNPVNPDLLARAENRLVAKSFLTSSDGDVVRRRWFLLDFDPVRPVGISSSAAEYSDAGAKATEVVEWLTSIGWPEPIRADSGNGVHVMYRVDEPNDDATRASFEFATKMLASIFSDGRVKVDISVYNASRIWKVYGTLSAKGSSTVDRPHRVATITSSPTESVLVTRAQIDNVASPLVNADPEEYRGVTGEYIADISLWLSERGQKVTSGPRPLFGSEGQKWIIDRCPFNENHEGPMIGLVGNRPIYKCLHESCSAFHWKEFREKIDPTYKTPDNILARLRGWCNGSAAEVDSELVQSACSVGKGLIRIIKILREECPTVRVKVLENKIKDERRAFQRATIGDNNEKGNLVGLINRTRDMQAAGAVPMYWVASYDHRVRVGDVGDIDSPKCGEEHEIQTLVHFHGLGDSWVKQTHIGQVIKYLAGEHQVNPLRLCLQQVKWDGETRISTWLTEYMGVKPGEYTAVVGRKWLISAVARATSPGCQADHMLILEGVQGIGKSQALRILGGRFYSEYSGGVTGGGTSHKDMVATIAGKIIVEMSELTSMRRADMEALKAVLTTTADDVRLSYERDPKTYPRTCVFAGSTNGVGQSYILDATGARRFWPVHVGECGPVKIEALKKARDQLWAEAVHAHDSGEDWHTVPLDEVAQEQLDRQVTVESTEPWFQKIRAALTDPDSYANEVLCVVPKFVMGQPTDDVVVRTGSMYTVLGSLLQIDVARQTQADVLRVQGVLRGLGFKKVRPSRKWQGGSYAYDLVQEAVPHLWSSIVAAQKSVKFMKSHDEMVMKGN